MGNCRSLEAKAYKFMNSIINVYTDGACKGNGSVSPIGGWAAVIDDGKQQLRLSGYGGHTTNNRMELQAVIEGLQAVEKVDGTIHVYTDSKYVQKGCSEWLTKWKANGWRTSSRTPVKNDDLWKVLDNLVQRLPVVFHWVKGHDGHTMNELADQLACQACGGKEAIRREMRISGDTSLSMQMQ